MGRFCHRGKVLGTIVAIASVLSAASGCASTGEPPAAGNACRSDEIYDSRVARCVRPSTQEEARYLATRADLEKTIKVGDAAVLAEVSFATSASRSELDKLLSLARPEAVEIVGFMFPELGGGLVVPVHLRESETLEAILDESKVRIADRFSQLSDGDLKALAPEFNKALDNEHERYVSIHVRAKPSGLLAAWESDSNIAYIAIITDAVE